MSFDLLELLRQAIDAAVDRGMTKSEIIWELKAAIEEVEEADDVPESGA
jgi:hypothetical protein